MPDRVCLQHRILPKLSATSFMGCLKGKRALLIFTQHAKLKCKYWNRHLGRGI